MIIYSKTLSNVFIFIYILFFISICHNIYANESTIQQFPQKDTFDDEKLHTLATYYAATLLAATDCKIYFHNTYLNLDNTPYAHIFIAENNNQVLTIALAPGKQHFPLMFFYYDYPIDLKMKKLHHITDQTEIIFTDIGIYLKNGYQYYVWPTMQAFTKSDIMEQLASCYNRNQQCPQNGLIKGNHETRLKKSWAVVDSILAGQKNQTVNPVEVIIPDVPLYSWYLNCGLISHTMILAYWNDHGYNEFVPGGNSKDGYYWAITEQLAWWGYLRVNHITYYTEAAEYGNHYPFISSGSLGKEWDVYKYNIDTYRIPLSVTWTGHSTVGVGYKEIDSQRFLIIHDPNSDVPVERNYDEYYDMLYSFSRTYPDTNSFNQTHTHYTNVMKSPNQDSFVLNSIDIQFTPPLKPEIKSYHCIECADINGDNQMDLLVCNFRNVLPPYKNLELYLNQNGQFVLDMNFAPIFESYQCLHVVKAVDFDHDGDMDVSIAGIDVAVQLFENESNILSNSPIVINDDRRPCITDFDWGDYDGDGDLDLVTAHCDEEIRLYQNQNDSLIRVGEINVGFQHLKVKFCDLDNNENLELIASDRAGSIIVFSYNNSALELTFSSSVGHGALTFDVADIDMDEYNEVVTIDDGMLLYFDNDNGQLIEPPIYFNTDFKCYANDIKLSDLDDDGFPELIVGNYNSHDAVFKNNNGEFDPTPFWMSEEIVPTVRIHVYDIQTNGKKEIVFVKSRGGKPEFFEFGPSTIERTYSLDRGWNLASFNLIPQNFDIEIMMNPLQDKLVLVKNSTGQIYNPETGHNEIGMIDLKQGYWMYMKDAIDFNVKGYSINLDSTFIELSEGWNIISYLPDAAFDISVALASINDKLILVKNNDGFVYIPQFEIDDIGLMQSGQGYQVYLSNIDTLFYPVTESGFTNHSSQSKSHKHASPVHFSFCSHTGENATVVLLENANPQYRDGSSLKTGDEIGIFKSNSICCGAAVWDVSNSAITVWGNNSQTTAIDGFDTGDTLYFKIWDKSTDSEYTAHINYCSGDSTIYQPDGFYVLSSMVGDLPTIVMQTKEKAIPTTFRLLQNYPNPFNPITHMSFDIPEECHVILIIYNTLGQKVQEFVNKNLIPGSYTIAWNSRNYKNQTVNSGIYFCKLKAENFEQVIKMTILK